MNVARRIARNSLFLFVGNVVSSLLGILLTVFLARYLGTAEFGKYTLAVALTTLFLVLTDMGLGALSMREIARNYDRAGEYFSTVCLIKLSLSIFMLAAIAVTANVLHYPGDIVRIVLVVGLVNVLNSFAAFCRYVFRAFERMEYDAATQSIERVLVVGSAIVVLLRGGTLTAVVIAMLAAQGLGLLVTFVLCVRRLNKPRLALDLSLAKHLLKMALPLALASVFANILSQADTVMLSKMKDEAAVGWYNAAYRPMSGLLLLPGIFVAAIFPLLARYHVTDKHMQAVTFAKSLKLLLVMAPPLGTGTMLIANRLVSVLYGAEFVNSVIVLQIIGWSVSLVFINTLLGHTLLAIDKPVVDMIITGAVAFLSVVLNALLIPQLSYVGAAITSVAAQALIFSTEYVCVRARIGRISLLNVIYKPLLGTVAMGIVVYVVDLLFNKSIIGLLVIVAAALATYVLFLFLLRTFDRDELHTLRSIFRHTRTEE